MTPRVSICIPAYNRPLTLRIAIESVLEQGLDDVEVLVTDDSGTLEDTVRAIGDRRLRYVRNPTRLGLAGNWSRALSLARAEIVGLLMDDDRLLPGFLRKALEPLEADPRVDVVFTDHFFDEDGRLRHRHCQLPGGRYESFLVPLVEHLPVPVSAALMRRSAYEPFLPLPDLLTADVALHVQLALAGATFVYVDEPLMAYRLHAGQLTLHEERFRHDRVAAWELFVFGDTRAERGRRRRLSDALLDRAAARLKRGDVERAIADLEAARNLDSSVEPRRAAVLRALARNPWAIQPSLAALRGLRVLQALRA